MTQLSVLMSLYIKEKTEYAKACFESLLEQSVKADEWVIVEDGPLTPEMYELIEKYQNENPGLIKRVRLEKNQGLGLALRVGVSECKNELIARMDTDDIAKPERFEKQLEEFKKNPDLDICGSNIDEFEGDISNIVARRTVPSNHEEIIKYQKRRDAFNHMTVMFKKSMVMKAGNYMSCPLMEDTYLWARMIVNGAICKNINQSLVYARVGCEMFERRGGWSYYKKYKAGKKKVLETGFIGTWDYVYTILLQLIVALVPGKIRALVFTKLLHR